MIYTDERQKKIVDDFRKLLMDADNFPRDKNPDDFKPFWYRLRGEGASLLGLTLHLTQSLITARRVIEELVAEKKRGEVEVAPELDKLTE